jgi:hypothetical protein
MAPEKVHWWIIHSNELKGSIKGRELFGQLNNPEAPVHIRNEQLPHPNRCVGVV